MNIVQHMNSLYYTEKEVKCIMFSKLQIELNHFPSIKHSYHYDILYKNNLFLLAPLQISLRLSTSMVLQIL